MPVNHLRAKKESKISFTLSSLSHIFLPTALQTAILSCRPHPSCLYQWLLLCYLCRENPLFDESAAVQMSRCGLPAGNPPLLLVGQGLVSKKIIQLTLSSKSCFCAGSQAAVNIICELLWCFILSWLNVEHFEITLLIYNIVASLGWVGQGFKQREIKCQITVFNPMSHTIYITTTLFP